MFVGFYCVDDLVEVEVYVEDNPEYCRLKSIFVTGSCGNLTFEKRKDAPSADDDGVKCLQLNLVLGSVEELKKAMTDTGNHRLDIQVTITALTIVHAHEMWIPR